uniref:Uncharacterized protein n=1 Tax=Knipowitschia caucasica TaxID=637954 RepID=A0AAV2MAG1_KNICA
MLSLQKSTGSVMAVCFRDGPETEYKTLIEYFSAYSHSLASRLFKEVQKERDSSGTLQGERVQTITTVFQMFKKG